MTEAYPLQWPDGQPRTPIHQRQYARFDTKQDAAQRGILGDFSRARKEMS